MIPLYALTFSWPIRQQRQNMRTYRAAYRSTCRRGVRFCMETITFADLPLRAELLRALSDLGYEEPTPIQREAIGPLVSHLDLVGQAATGTGKTAAFTLPMLQRVTGAGNNPIGLILAPTRELAMQVSEAAHKYGRNIGARVLPLYGGQPIGRQLHALKRGVDIVVATPGRAIDHLKRKSLILDDISMVVLDEADEMLDMGFAEDLETILNALPKSRQTVLFSATMPPRIEKLAKKHLRNPVSVQIEGEPTAQGETPRIQQVAYVVPRAHKAAALGRILDVESPQAAIVFCRTRNEVDQLAETLNGRGYRAEALHGGLGQEHRDRVMGRVRNGTADLLIATDVAARGLDIDVLTHVVNFDVPSAPESYVHRIGRVGRAGREGMAITLVEPRESRLLSNIERVVNDKIDVRRLPTVADAQNQRLAQTADVIREAMEEDLDDIRRVVDELSEEFDVYEIALAAIKVVHDSRTGDDNEVEIPHVELHRSGKNKSSEGSRNGKFKKDKYEKFDKREKHDKHDKKSKKGKPDSSMTRLYFPIGRRDRVRPGDLVGAIAGETRLSGRDIGSIEIAEKFSLVEVPDTSVDEIVKAMKKTQIRGRNVVPRRERFERYER